VVIYDKMNLNGVVIVFGFTDVLSSAISSFSFPLSANPSLIAGDVMRDERN
jgi:hypothetical protein